MTIKIQKQKLLEIADTLKPFIPKNPLVPIVENVLVEYNIGESELTIRATDLNNTCVYRLSVLDADIDGFGKFCFDINLISEYIKTISDELIEIDFSDNGLSLIRKEGNFIMQLEDSKDYPIKPIPDVNDSVKLSSKDIATQIKHVLDNTPPITGGMPTSANYVYIVKDNELNCTVINSFNKHYSSFVLYKIDKKIPTIAISQENCVKLNHFLSKKDDISLNIEGIDVILNTKDTTVIIRGTDSFKSNNYAFLLNTKFDKSAVIPKVEFIEKVNRVGISIKNTVEDPFVELSCVNGVLNIVAQDTNYGISANETIELGSESNDFDINLNIKALIRVLKTITTDIFTVKILGINLLIEDTNDGHVIAMAGVVKY